MQWARLLWALPVFAPRWIFWIPTTMTRLFPWRPQRPSYPCGLSSQVASICPWRRLSSEFFMNLNQPLTSASLSSGSCAHARDQRAFRGRPRHKNDAVQCSHRRAMGTSCRLLPFLWQFFFIVLFLNETRIAGPVNPYNPRRGLAAANHFIGHVEVCLSMLPVPLHCQVTVIWQFLGWWCRWLCVRWTASEV